MIRCTFAAVVALASCALALRAQEPSPTNQAPSAELIIDAEQTVTKEPVLAPGEEPLPPMDGNLPAEGKAPAESKLPGEENIFGAELFGATPAYTPAPEAQIPERPPLVEDPQEAQRKQRVQFRKIKAVVERDPQLVQLQQDAADARTPEGSRAARRSYYVVFFSKVRKADPSLAKYCDALEKQSVAVLYQTRVEPTVPLEPPPLPQPAPSLVPPPQYPPADVIPPR